MDDSNPQAFAHQIDLELFNSNGEDVFRKTWKGIAIPAIGHLVTHDSMVFQVVEVNWNRTDLNPMLVYVKAVRCSNK